MRQATDARAFLRSALAAIRSDRFESRIEFDEAAGDYLDSSVYRGFPLATIGTGGLSVGTDGGFLSLRTNNNWMSPVTHLKGAFLDASRGELRLHPQRLPGAARQRLAVLSPRLWGILDVDWDSPGGKSELRIVRTPGPALRLERVRWETNSHAMVVPVHPSAFAAGAIPLPPVQD